MQRVRDYKQVPVENGYEVHATFGKQKIKVPIATGGYDRLRVFREGDDIVFLSMNTQLEYCGIEVYSLKHETKLEDLFLRGEQINEVLGKRGLDQTDLGIVRKLYHHWSECFC